MRYVLILFLATLAIIHHTVLSLSTLAGNRYHTFRRIIPKSNRITPQMPSCFVTSASEPKCGAKEFCAKLSKTVASALGKPESYVLTSYTKADAMSFGGDAETPSAFLYLSSLGSINPESNAAASAAIANILEEELGVSKNRYYINFFDSERSNMGFNGATF